MMFTEINVVYCENHRKHTNTACVQNSDFYYVKACGASSDHWILNLPIYFFPPGNERPRFTPIQNIRVTQHSSIRYMEEGPF
jgi:hypothetical protein